MSPKSSCESAKTEVSNNLEKSQPEWLQSPWILKTLFLVVLLVCYGITVNVRYQQLQTWEQNPQQFFVGEQPLMTTLDAPFWLRWAKEYRDGEFYGTGHKRSYPTNTQWFREQQAQILVNEKKIQIEPVAPLELSTSPTSPSFFDADPEIEEIFYGSDS